jgi:hypothetical protein
MWIQKLNATRWRSSQFRRAVLANFHSLRAIGKR